MKPSASELSDAQWAILEPLILPAKPEGRPRSVNRRQILHGIFSVLRSGGAWRLLPLRRTSLPLRRPNLAIKAFLRQAGARTREALQEAIAQALLTVTPKACSRLVWSLWLPAASRWEFPNQQTTGSAAFLIGAINPVGETYRYNTLALAPELDSAFYSYQ